MSSDLRVPREATSEKTKRVLVVDDSALMRQTMVRVLSSVGGFEVSVAADPLIALRKISESRPDVIVLDLEMPKMDGLTFLRRIMVTDPLPVVVCSGLVGDGAVKAITALEAGAVEVIAKPRIGLAKYIEDSAVVLSDAIRAASITRVGGGAKPTDMSASVTPEPGHHAPSAVSQSSLSVTTEKVIAVGASTGGTDAIRQLLSGLPPTMPGVIIVQHMPAGFTSAFAERLNEITSTNVKEAENGDRISAGKVLIAPGNLHTRLRLDGAQYRVVIEDGPLVSRHRPSVDVLFKSVAEVAGRNAVGVILTGMGRDGADGLLEMRRVGATTIAQDESTSVVYGMPREAIEAGAAMHTMPLDRIGASLRNLKAM